MASESIPLSTPVLQKASWSLPQPSSGGALTTKTSATSTLNSGLKNQAEKKAPAPPQDPKAQDPKTFADVNTSAASLGSDYGNAGASQVNKDEAKNAEDLGHVIDEINSTLYSMSRNLRFEIHEETEELVVRVVNTQTEEVLRQYPSEEVLKNKERLIEGETQPFSVRVD